MLSLLKIKNCSCVLPLYPKDVYAKLENSSGFFRKRKLTENVPFLSS